VPQIGRYIQSRGGVVAAEEVAPFLDVTPGQVASDRGRVTLDESYMLPVLARLGGEPQVDSAGNLLYSFPSLQQTGAVRAAPERGHVWPRMAGGVCEGACVCSGGWGCLAA
jgi:hypothetical protein